MDNRLLKTKRNNETRKRKYFIRPDNLDRGNLLSSINEDFFSEIKGNPKKFFKYTRTTLPIFNALLTLLTQKLERRKTSYTISSEVRLAVTLSYLSQGVSYQFLENTFKIGKSTARGIIFDTCDALWDMLAPIYVTKCTTHDYKQIAKGFLNKWNLPNCIGAIDGKFISINSANKSKSFYNCKDFYSIVILGSCDANYLFTMVEVGGYDSDSDGGLLRESSFGKDLFSEQLDLPSDAELSNSNYEFPHYFVGDTAFPLKKNLMRPYPGKSLSLDRKIFNYRISRARSVIENAFGILFARWRILRKTFICSPNNAEKITLACIALHNFFKLNDESYQYCPLNYIDNEDENGKIIPGGWREQLADYKKEPKIKLGSNNSSKNVFVLRDKLKDYFLNEGAIELQKKIE